MKVKFGLNILHLADFLHIFVEGQVTLLLFIFSVDEYCKFLSFYLFLKLQVKW